MMYAGTPIWFKSSQQPSNLSPVLVDFLYLTDPDSVPYNITVIVAFLQHRTHSLTGLWAILDFFIENQKVSSNHSFEFDPV